MSESQMSSLSDGSAPVGPTLIFDPKGDVKFAALEDGVTNFKHQNEQLPADFEVPSALGENQIGDFRILREIGRGGMGIVYEAVEQSLQRRVALKILPAVQNADKRRILRFQNESRAAAHLQHPNIVPVYAVGSESGQHFYTMQLINGRHLESVIRQARELRSGQSMKAGRKTAQQNEISTVQTGISDDERAAATVARSASHNSSANCFPSIEYVQVLSGSRGFSETRSSFSSVVRIGIQAADALSYAHQLGIIHRDIKPSNLMLDEVDNLWVTDFGLAHFHGASGLTMTGEVIGTLRYMSPEQALGQRVTIDHRTDIYSLGITLYELVTLRKAFDGATSKELIRQVCFESPISIRRLCPGVPEELETIIQKSISKNPDDRYQSAHEFADDLRRFAADQPILARRPNLIQKCQRWVRQNTAQATAIAGAGLFIVMLTLLASGMIWNSRNDQIILRKRAESLLDKSEGLRLLAEAAPMRLINPGLSLLMTIRGATLAPGVEGNSAILTTMGQNHEFRSFIPRSTACETLAVSPDGKRVVTMVGRTSATTGDSYPAIEFDVEQGTELRTYDTGNAVTAAAYSPDGKYLLTATGTLPQGMKRSASDPDGAQNLVVKSMAALWDISNGNRIQMFPDAGLANVSTASFSPTAASFALPGPSGTIGIYSMSDGSPQSVLRGHSDHVFSVVFHADGHRLVSASNDNTVRVWDSESGSELKAFTIDGILDQAGPKFGANSDQVIVSTASGTQLLSVETGKPIHDVPWPETSFEISDNGSTLALFKKFQSQVSIQNLKAGIRNPTVMVPGTILSVDVSESGQSLLVTTTNEAFVFATSDGRQKANLKGHTDRVIEGQFVPGKDQVVTASNDLTLRCWNIPDGNSLMRLHQNAARSAPGAWSFSSDSKHVISANRPAWNALLLNSDGTPGELQFPGKVIEGGHSDGQRLVTSDERYIYVTQLTSVRGLARFEVPAGDMVSLVHGLTGTDFVVVLLDSGKLLRWNVRTNEVAAFAENRDRVAWFLAHPKTGRMVVTQENGVCMLVDGPTFDVLGKLTHDHEVVSSSFDQDGAQFLTVDSQNKVSLWDSETRSVVRTFAHPEARCGQAMFSPDGTAIVTWDQQSAERIIFWQKSDGKLLMESPAVSKPSVSLHEVESLAAVASEKDGLWIFDWNAATQRQISVVPTRSPLFQKDRIGSLDGDPVFDISSNDQMIGHVMPAFARSSLVFRNIASGEILSSRRIDGEGFELTTNTNASQVVVSVRRYGVEVIQIADGRHEATVGNHSAPLSFQGIAGSGSDLKAVCASLDGSVSVHDTSGQLLHRLSRHARPIMSAALSSDGSKLAVFHDDGIGDLWAMTDGTHLAEFTGHSATVPVVQFTASGKKLLTASGDASLHIRDLDSGTDRILTQECGIIDAQWFPDERRVLVITSRRSESTSEPDTPNVSAGALIIDTDSGKQTSLVTGDPLKSGKISPNGELIAVVTEQEKVRLFLASDGSRVDAFSPERRPIEAVAFSPDNAEILLRHDAELSLWEIATQTEICRYPDSDRLYWGGGFRTSNVWQPFTPDGQSILSATPALQKWPRDPLTMAVKASPRPFSNSEMQRYGITLLTESADDGSGND